MDSHVAESMQQQDSPRAADAQSRGTTVMSHEGGLPLPFDLAPFRHFDASAVQVEPVEPLDQRFRRYGGRCLLLRHILTPEECRLLVRELGGEMSPVKFRSDYRLNDRAIFNSPGLAEVLWSRVAPVAANLVLQVPEEASKQRLLSAAEEEEKEEEEEAEEGDCPEELQVGYGQEGLWRPLGLNESFRFCRYNPGGFFRPHCDASFQRSEDERSFFTCMFYLDGGLDGGATRFLRTDGCLSNDNYLQQASQEHVLASVPPEEGLCILFFQQGLLHEGTDLLSGSKHILRTDVMFRRDEDSKPQLSAQQREARDLVTRAQAAEASVECDLAASLYRRAFKLDPRLERMF